MGVNDDVGLEGEADLMGGRGLQKMPLVMTYHNDPAENVIQLVPKNIHDTVFYGPGTHRIPYVAKDSSIDSSMPHLTIDTLNSAIGLSLKTLGNVGMVEKRRLIEAALDPTTRGANLSDDENAWITWLNDPSRRTALLMPSMNGSQCRFDMGMGMGLLTDPTPHQNVIDDGNDGQWTQGLHSNENVTTFDNLIIGANEASSVPMWNLVHDYYVNYRKNPIGVFLNYFLSKNIEYLTDHWLIHTVMRHFFRLTSLIGMDFLSMHEKQIVFIRNPDQNPYDPPDGTISITESEWNHAVARGYIHNLDSNDDTVTQHAVPAPPP